MSFSGSMIQNAIYIAQQPPDWPVAVEDWERAAEEKLDPGAFGYIAGGAGRSRRCARTSTRSSSWRIRPRMLTGNVDARHLGRRARAALARTVPPRAGRRALDRARGGRGGVAQAAASSGVPLLLSSAATHSIEEVAATGAPALVPALLGQRPRDLRELRQARRGRRLRRDRRHARHADARLAAARPAAGLPAVHQGRGLRPVLQRPGLPLAARQDAGGGLAHGRRDDARHVPEPRPDVGRPRLAARADGAADPRQGRADRRRRAARARARHRRRDRLEPRRPSGRRRGRCARRTRRGARRAARTPSC